MLHHKVTNSTSILTLCRTARLFSTARHYFTFPPTANEDSHFSPSSPTLASVRLFYDSHPGGCWILLVLWPSDLQPPATHSLFPL